MARGSNPLYQSLVDALRRAIESGEYPVGSLLPTEKELCERFGVSRHTVREASRRLADIGLIVRRAGLGTTVSARTASPRFTASLGSLTELLQFTQSTRLEILETERIKADAALADVLRCRLRQPWVRLRTLRYPSGSSRPLSHTSIFLLPEFEGIERHVKAGTQTIFGLIEEHYSVRILEVLQDIGACAIEPAVAALLGVRSGSPGLSVHRHYLGVGSKPLAISLNTFAENRFRLSTRWRLGWGQDLGDAAD